MENDFAIIHVVQHLIFFIVAHSFVYAARPNSNSRSHRPPKLK